MKVRCKVCGKVFDVDDSYNKTIYCPFCASNLHNPNYAEATKQPVASQSARVAEISLQPSKVQEKETQKNKKEGFFDNPGSTLQLLGEITFVLGILAVIISGIVLMIADDAFSGLIILVAGIFGIFLVSFSIIGFGRLVENSDKIRKRLTKKDN